jgi:CDGSH-type Zn-finger protein
MIIKRQSKQTIVSGVLKSMSDPEIAAKEPAAVKLEAGKTYFWCTCGKSLKQPFCDGAHKGTDFRPQRFTSENAGEAWLCQCKKTQKGPYCDGSHNAI